MLLHVLPQTAHTGVSHTSLSKLQHLTVSSGGLSVGMCMHHDSYITSLSFDISSKLYAVFAGLNTVKEI